jgi:hypothetical protein
MDSKDLKIKTYKELIGSSKSKEDFMKAIKVGAEVQYDGNLGIVTNTDIVELVSSNKFYPVLTVGFYNGLVGKFSVDGTFDLDINKLSFLKERTFVTKTCYTGATRRADGTNQGFSLDGILCETLEEAKNKFNPIFYDGGIATVTISQEVE